MLGLRTHGCITAVVESVDIERACVEEAASSTHYGHFLFGFEVGPPLHTTPYTILPSTWPPTPPLRMPPAAQVLRLVLIWTAFVLLATGHAYGGGKQRELLEHLRLDFADGDLDGEINLDRAKPKKRTASRKKQPAKREDERRHYAERVADPSVYQKFMLQQQVERGGERRVGGVLPYFLVYDVAVLAFLISVWLVVHVWSRGIDTADPIFWSSLYILKTTCKSAGLDPPTSGQGRPKIHDAHLACCSHPELARSSPRAPQMASPHSPS